MADSNLDNLKIREARESDFEGVDAIFFEVRKLHYENEPEIYQKPKLSSPDLKKEFSEMADDQSKRYFVATINDEIVGLTYITIAEKRKNDIFRPGKYGFLNHVGVKEDFRHKGIGTALVHKALEEARRERVEEFAVNVGHFNEGAIKFYESLGFRVLSLRMNKRDKNE